jgi:hypothetical protein
MDQLLLLKVPKMGTTGRSVGAGISSASDSHTGPDFEARFSGSPALPCPTAKHSSKSEQSSQEIRREDQPVTSQCAMGLWFVVCPSISYSVFVFRRHTVHLFEVRRGRAKK